MFPLSAIASCGKSLKNFAIDSIGDHASIMQSCTSRPLTGVAMIWYLFMFSSPVGLNWCAYYEVLRGECLIHEIPASNIFRYLVFKMQFRAVNGIKVSMHCKRVIPFYNCNFVHIHPFFKVSDCGLHIQLPRFTFYRHFTHCQALSVNIFIYPQVLTRCKESLQSPVCI